MTFRLAFRSLAARPVRSAVLACGFGFGIAVMAALLGVGEVILEQARAPELAGGGDIRVVGRAGRLGSARLIASDILDSPRWAGRFAGLSPSRSEVLYLQTVNGPVPLLAHGGIPSMERSVDDPETSRVAAWVDAPSDSAWSAPDPGDVLRALDRFHPVPEVAARESSWAEWLYFNGRAEGVRFYLTFLVGPPSAPGRRSALVRLQLERDGRMVGYSEAAEVDAAEVLDGAPDLSIGRNSVRLEGLRYRLRLDLDEERESAGGGEASARLTGEVTLDAVRGRSLPPLTIHGAGGWRSGYTVPVPAGNLGGRLIAPDGTAISLAGGTGYHDHNWGFWEGVSWQWGQVEHAGVSLVYGRIRPPADAADPERLPGFLAAVGPRGLLGFSTDVSILESDPPERNRPDRIVVRARGATGEVDMTMTLDVEHAVRTRLDRGPLGRVPEREFLQLRGTYAVEGVLGGQALAFTAPGAAETFRDPPL